VKKIIAVSILFLVAVGIAHPTPMPTQYFSNTYSNSGYATSWDQVNNIVYWIETFTGTTTDQTMKYMSAQHIPKATVHFNGAAQTWQGTGFAPSANMNASHIFPFDLNSCGGLLDTGQCYGDSQPQIFCTSAGIFYILYKQTQWEVAITTSQVYPTPLPDGWYPEVPYCSSQSSPPDWEGPHETNVYGTGFFRCKTICYRVVDGTSFSGVKWNCFPFGPCKQVVAASKPDCTNNDKGIHPVY